LVELPPTYEDSNCYIMPKKNPEDSDLMICNTLDVEFAIPYLLLVSIVSVIGMVFVELMFHRYEKWVSPLSDKFMARYNYVKERDAATTLIQDGEQQKANTHPLLYYYQASYLSK